ncbi:hypothetical protein [Desulfatibacillum aliphaticivorans]|uniref:hypothetical protein n=1 Tax=Desulfatibacillum aliphaticivorans TaxID=218208 RepID=UPI00040316C1|nr:hypothetical protein [Desulfatibacillum aliphaticivorans]
MKKFIWGIVAVMLLCMAAGCSGDEDNKGSSAAAKEVKNPMQTQVNAMDKAAKLSHDLSAQQQANQAEMDKILEE